MTDNPSRRRARKDQGQLSVWGPEPEATCTVPTMPKRAPRSRRQFAHINPAMADGRAVDAMPTGWNSDDEVGRGHPLDGAGKSRPTATAGGPYGVGRGGLAKAISVAPKPLFVIDTLTYPCSADSA